MSTFLLEPASSPRATSTSETDFARHAASAVFLLGDRGYPSNDHCYSANPSTRPAGHLPDDHDEVVELKHLAENFVDHELEFIDVKLLPENSSHAEEARPELRLMNSSSSSSSSASSTSASSPSAFASQASSTASEMDFSTDARFAAIAALSGDVFEDGLMEKADFSTPSDAVWQKFGLSMPTPPISPSR